MLAILDHAYEDVREELQHKVIDEDTKHFNEDFAWVVRSPVTGIDYLMRQVVQFSSGTSVDFGKLRERRRVDPAMLHVLKFEKMATGNRPRRDRRAGQDQGRARGGDRAREGQKGHARARRDTPSMRLRSWMNVSIRRTSSARALGVAKVKKYEPPEEEEDG